MVDYTLDIQPLINNVRITVGDPDFAIINDDMIMESLEDAFDFVCLVAAPDIELRNVRRCTIRHAAYNAYQLYTTMAEKRFGTLPEGAPILLQTLLSKAHTCLSYISAVPINNDLSINYNAMGSPTQGGMSISMVNP
jgi:hypothetical protein